MALTPVRSSPGIRKRVALVIDITATFRHVLHAQEDLRTHADTEARSYATHPNRQT